MVSQPQKKSFNLAEYAVKYCPMSDTIESENIRWN